MPQLGEQRHRAPTDLRGAREAGACRDLRRVVGVGQLARLLVEVPDPAPYDDRIPVLESQKAGHDSRSGNLPGVQDALRPTPPARRRVLTPCVALTATNALLHGVPPGRLFRVRIEAAEEEVRIEVRDSGPGRPTAQSPHTDSENGRGLLLVGELADAWGDIEHTVGKTVWFTVKATQAQGRAQ
ncbi:regulatory protein [Streptomyces hygroscopicus]|nr:regulatory protein [Streptomyces hygroscopicus]